MHVAIDTSVYRTDPKRTKTGFQAITRLAAARQIQIHLPYYVGHEFLTQQTECLSQKFRTMIKAASSVSRLTEHDSTVDVINQTLDEVRKLADGAAATASEELVSIGLPNNRLLLRCHRAGALDLTENGLARRLPLLGIRFRSAR